ncbi:hypothetical protein [Halochromatium sp.]
MDKVRSLMQRLHYAIHAGRSYSDRIVRNILFHRVPASDELLRARAAEAERFLT